VFGQKFTCNGNSIEHGTQVDGYSCGIILGNTIEHAINATPVWEHQQATIERLHWFQHFSNGINHDVKEVVASSNFSNTTKDMLTENPELSISIALGDHNFPDLAQFALGSDTDTETKAPPLDPSTAARTHLSFKDILNPASEDSKWMENTSSKPDVTAVDGSLSSLSEDLGGQGGQAGNVTDADLASNIESTMDTDSPQWETGGVTDTSSGRDFMDVDGDEENGSSVYKAIESGGVSRHLKRSRVVSDSDTDSYASDENKVYQLIKGKVGRSEATSRSAKASWARREKLCQGELKINEALFEQWKQKLLADNSNVEFHSTNVCSVRHLTCGRNVLMKEVCDATRWQTHLKECNTSGRKKRPSAGVPTLLKMGFGSVKASIGSNLIKKKPPTELESNDKMGKHKTIPCPGITEVNNPSVPTYLRRTAVSGGGARSVKMIAGEIHKKHFSVLGTKAK